MKFKNRMSRFGYLLDTAYWYILFFIFYRSQFFIPAPGLSYQNSLLLLAILSGFSAAVGFFLSLKKRRNHFSLFPGLAVGFGLYFCLSFRQVWPVGIALVLAALAVLAVGYIALVLANYFRSPHRHRVSLEKCLGLCLRNCHIAAGWVCTAAFLVLMVCPLLGLPLVHSQSAKAEPQPEGATIAGNMDTVLLLQESEWEKLNTTQRLAVMKTVADIEANYLGIPEAKVSADPLRETLLGYYSFSQNTVTINLHQLSTRDAHTMLTVICHEMYHAYQHRLVSLYDQAGEEYQDLLLFSQTATYKDEFSHYISAQEDYDDYANQQCEQESNKYAQIAVMEYYARISQHLDTD